MKLIYEKCSLVGGPLDGEEEKIVCVMKNSPCEVRYLRRGDSYYKYALLMGEEGGRKDAKGRWVFVFREWGE